MTAAQIFHSRKDLVQTPEGGDGYSQNLHQLAALLIHIAAKHGTEPRVESEKAPVKNARCVFGDGVDLGKTILYELNLLRRHCAAPLVYAEGTPGKGSAYFHVSGLRRLGGRLPSSAATAFSA